MVRIPKSFPQGPFAVNEARSMWDRSWDSEHSSRLFVDASYYASLGDAAFGFAPYFMDSFVAVGFSKGPRSSSAKEAEARASLFMLKAIKTCNHSRVILCFDALQVVRAVKGEVDWQIHPITCDILECYGNSGSFQVRHISRENNMLAHHLARLGQRD
ncbi:hypothetical protein AAC387_Pa02g0115 [Persea americana]